MHTIEEKKDAFEKVLHIMDTIRNECPWDRKQTNETLRPLTIEEVYELTDAVLKKDSEALKIELGDVFLHILFYSKIASEENTFDIADVLETLSNKLIHRHPHVFSKDKTDSRAEEIEKKWEILKLKEKKGTSEGVLGGVPDALPALIKAERLQHKAKGVGFDWEKKEHVWDKIKEEIQEFETEIQNNDLNKMEGEFGDLLFALINMARLYGIRPDNALERTNQKFIRRFNYLEKRTIEQGKSLPDMTLQEMEELWQEAKKDEN